MSVLIGRDAGFDIAQQLRLRLAVGGAVDHHAARVKQRVDIAQCHGAYPPQAVAAASGCMDIARIRDITAGLSESLNQEPGSLLPE